MPKQKSANLEEIKKYFNDENITEHLKKVFAKLIIERPADPKAVFEEYSKSVKGTTYDPNYSSLHALEKTNTLYEENLEKVAKLLEFMQKAEDAEGEPAEVEKKESSVQNIQELFMMLSQAGIGFGADLAHLLQKSLNELAQRPNASKAPKPKGGKEAEQRRDIKAKYVRLLGKVYGRRSDLWVAEMLEDGKEAEDFDLNKFTYFVSENPAEGAEGWTELPQLTIPILLQAQRIKRLLSGNLDSRIVTNPVFEGREDDYLRAQVARITHSTTIIPEGIYEIPDREGDPTAIGLKDEETKETKSTLDLVSGANWVFLRPGILPSGLLKAVVEEGDDDEQKKDENKETTMERLLKLDTDKDNWKIQLQGLSDLHKFSDKEVVNYGVNVLQSLRWPGALTVQYKGTYYNFYLGWGLKAKTRPFYPIYPPSILDDPSELTEQIEPYPRETVHEENQQADGADADE